MIHYDLEFPLRHHRLARSMFAPRLGLFGVLAVLAVVIGVVLGFAT
jgi:hypothetical protein